MHKSDILPTVNLTNIHYYGILLNMSQRDAHFNQISLSSKLPTAILSNDPGNRQQAIIHIH